MQDAYTQRCRLELREVTIEQAGTGSNLLAPLVVVVEEDVEADREETERVRSGPSEKVEITGERI